MSESSVNNEAQSLNKGAVTAGLRGASWNPSLVPSDMRTSVYSCVTTDGAAITGFLHARGGERSVAFIMHPRELLVTHYLVPLLVRAGYACWVQGARTVGNDLRLEHELAVHDVGAGMVQLRKLGFSRITLVGNSGGASLFALYNQQSLTGDAERISHTPAGRPTKLGGADLPVADGFVFVAPHPGQGKLLLGMIDPSVIDEADARSCDPALDPFNPANGYRCESDGGANYSAHFLDRYRSAQHARVARIDASAHALLDQRKSARARSKAGEASGFYDGSYSGIFNVWRTDADPRSFDLSLDPSDRRWGSLWGADPAASNVGSVGFARVCTPESWLSTWSGISSNASFDRCGAAIEQPVMMIDYTGDNSVFPSECDAIFATIGSSDKVRHRVRGNHHGQPLQRGEPSGQEAAGAIIVHWLNERWGQ